MKKEHQLNLIRLALHLLRNERKGIISVHGKKMQFNMADFFMDNGKVMGLEEINLNHCGTSCCALGDWILLNKIEKIDIIDISENQFGIGYSSHQWDYLFGGDNPNLVLSFAGRVYDVLHNNCNYCSQFTSKKEAIRALMKNRQEIIETANV